MNQFEQSPNLTPAAAERDRQNIENQLPAHISNIFDKSTNSNERVDDIFKNLGNIIDQLENAEEIKHDLEGLRGVEEKEEFCSRALTVLKQLVDWRANHLVEFENIRRQDFNEQGGFTELNQMLSYGLDGDTIHLHVPPNVSTPDSKKLRLVREGLQKLATIVNQDPSVKTIVATSWIVAKHPDLMTKLHFNVEGPIDEETRARHFNAETRDIALATISREDLIKYHS